MNFRSAFRAAAFSLALGGALAAHATDYGWARPVSGAYSDGSLWEHTDPDTSNPLPGAPTPSDSVFFSIAGTYTVSFSGESATETNVTNGTPTFDVSGNFDAGSLNATDSTLTVTGGGTLTASSLDLDPSKGPFLLQVQSGAAVSLAASVEGLAMSVTEKSFFEGAGLTGSGPIEVDGAGSAIENSGAFSGVSLSITNGAQVTNGSTGTVTNIIVSGGSSLDSGALVMGSGPDSSSGDLQVSTGGTVMSSSAILSQVPAFDDPLGQVTLDGASSSWTISGALQVAVASGNEADVTVRNGAQLHAASADVGVSAEGGNSDRPDVPATGLFYVQSKASATFDGLLRIGIDGTGFLAIDVGSEVSTGSGLQVGSTGDGTVVVNGLLDISGDIDLGIKNGGSGQLEVNGTAASVHAPSSTLTIGDLSIGEFEISGGAAVEVAKAEVAVGFDAEAIINVTDATSKWTIDGPLDLGTEGDVAMRIGQKGSVSCQSATLAESVGLSTVIVSDSGSAWTVAENLVVGAAGDGVLIVQEGAHVTVGGASVTVAASGDAFGLLSIGGKKSVVDASGAQLNVGGSDQGFMEVLAGGSLSTAGAEIGFLSDGAGIASVDGKNSLWTVAGNLVIGVNGTGALVTTHGGKVVSGPITVGPNGAVKGSSTVVASIVNGGSVSPSTPDSSGIPEPPTNPASAAALRANLVAPATLAPGTMTIQGDYTQTSAGILNVNLGGNSAVDALQVSGKVTLGGTLNVALVNGFNPAASQSFTIVKAGSVSGTFAQVNGADITYGPHGVTVKPKLIPTPLTVTVSPAGPPAGGTVTAGFLGTTQRVVGFTYAITAIPAHNFVFTSWSGGATSSTPVLSFVMAPNLSVQANFVPNPFGPVTGTYRGLAANSGSSGLADGSLSLALAGSGHFTAKFLLGGHAYAFSGAFNGLGSYSKTVTIAGTALAISLSVDLNGGTDTVTGSVGINGQTYEVTADRATFNARANPAPEAGRYTVVFPPNADNSDADAPRPQGDGWATVSVTAAGQVAIGGRLADGTSWSAGGTLAKDGSFDLLASLYRGQGVFAGKMQFAVPPRSTDPSTSDVTGTFTWTKPSQIFNSIFPNPFQTTVAATGSLYTVPGHGTRILSGLDATGDAQLQFQGRDLPSELTKNITISLQNLVAYPVPSPPGDKLTLHFKLGTGAMNGTFDRGFPPKSTSFTGVVLQKQQAGDGFFLGSSDSGTVELSPP